MNQNYIYFFVRSAKLFFGVLNFSNSFMCHEMKKVENGCSMLQNIIEPCHISVLEFLLVQSDSIAAPTQFSAHL